ncbi:type VI secretion system protein TssL, long form [Gallaecimonas xiamenensis]|uniref:DotU family type IV / VI secretion system protein n=1 Tax=Gallaecimonas xiamenensis 3-C-1 TaxID=745411 RepID=K2JMK0_9GAMM|nr:type VI secretion system protein TssL, long form [Gallaecimonas xiamenensis]EKE75637.1 DotU family type IV / VI secretion system protein [Gallaecimonas xiamenensis 3-C-1]
MKDSTIIKPRPGARQAQPRPATPPAGNDDKTAFAVVNDDFQRGRFRLPGTHLDVLSDEASKLLSLADRLGQASAVDDISTLKRQCMDLVRDYQRALQGHQIPQDSINMASYCLCALLDELVLNSPWGGSGQWAASSLLSEFHSETLAGVHFFELVEKAQRTNDVALLTLQFLCLSLGFKGKYRVENLGQEALDGLKDRIYQQVCADKGRYATPFERDWQQKLVPGDELTQRFPLWVVFALCGVVLLLGYMTLAYNLNQRAQPVFLDLARVAVAPPPVEGEGDLSDSADARYLRQILQTEIDKGLLEMVYLSDRIRLRIGNEALFASGSATVREDMSPVLSKIARALESTNGRILITGHTDDQPIFTTKYPSNWHLSLARANAVANVLAAGGKLGGRLWPEGRGEAEPLFPNDSADNRARNRRVEIDLIP